MQYLKWQKLNLNLFENLTCTYFLKNLNVENLNALSKCLPTSGFIWIGPKEFDFNKYTNKSSIGCVLEVNLKYQKELRELHYDYPLAPYKIEYKREMLSEYQLKIEKLVPNFFHNEK